VSHIVRQARWGLIALLVTGAVSLAWGQTLRQRAPRPAPTPSLHRQVRGGGHIPSSQPRASTTGPASSGATDPRAVGAGTQPAGTPVAGRSYYIALAGSDSNPGTLDQPFLHFAKFTQVARPGDTGYVRGGTYDDYLYGMRLTGTPNAPITFRSYPGEEVIIDRHNPANTKYPYAVLVGHPSEYQLGGYVHIDGFKIRNAPAGISVAHASGVVIRNLEVSGCSTGIVVTGECADTVVEDCHVHHCTNVAIAITDNDGRRPGEPRNAVIRRCLVHDVAGSNPDANDGLDMIGVLGGEVADNIVYNCLDDCIDICGATSRSHDGSLHVCIHDNITFLANAPRTATGNGNGIKVSTRAGGDHTVFGNIVFGCDRAALDQDIGPHAPGNYFYNNTCWSNGRFGLVLDAGKGEMNVAATVVNNVFARHAADDMKVDGLNPIRHSDYNLLMDGKRPAGEGPHTRAGDPQFVDPYARDDSLWVSNSGGRLDAEWKGSLSGTMAHIRSQVLAAFALRPGSPCLGAGTAVPGVADARSGPPNIGAIDSAPLKTADGLK
jgi:hypothetical protein